MKLGTHPAWTAGFKVAAGGTAQKAPKAPFPHAHTQGKSRRTTLTALNDASRGQWPKQCCRKR